MLRDRMGKSISRILTSDPVVLSLDCIKFNIDFMSTVKFYI